MDWNRRTHIPGQFCEDAMDWVKLVGLFLLALFLLGLIAITFGLDD